MLLNLILDELKEKLEDFVSQTNSQRPGFIKVVRHSKQEGLIRSRVSGWRAATAPVVALFDAHVEFNIGWWVTHKERFIMLTLDGTVESHHRVGFKKWSNLKTRTLVSSACNIHGEHELKRCVQFGFYSNRGTFSSVLAEVKAWLSQPIRIRDYKWAVQFSHLPGTSKHIEHSETLQLSMKHLKWKTVTTTKHINFWANRNYWINQQIGAQKHV